MGVISAIGRPTADPAVPLAGKPFRVSFPLTRAGTSRPLRDPKLTVTPSINGAVVAHAERLDDLEAQVAVRVPKTAKGQRLRVEIIVRVGPESVSKAVVFRVR